MTVRPASPGLSAGAHHHVAAVTAQSPAVAQGRGNAPPGLAQQTTEGRRGNPHTARRHILRQPLGVHQTHGLKHIKAHHYFRRVRATFGQITLPSGNCVNNSDFPWSHSLFHAATRFHFEIYFIYRQHLFLCQEIVRKRSAQPTSDVPRRPSRKFSAPILAARRAHRRIPHSALPPCRRSG